MPFFITFEGVEGSGKSYQARRLYNYFRRKGISAVLTHEPGGSPAGERISRILMSGNLSALAELMLFNASRAELIATVIRPKLEEGFAVICDRYADSTIAYQGYGRGLDLNLVRHCVEIVVQQYWPVLTFLLDLPVEAGLLRKRDRGLNRFDLETIDFHRRVRAGYLELAAAQPDRWVVIDANQGRGEVARAIINAVSEKYPFVGEAP